jgi:hypothetical protein
MRISAVGIPTTLVTGYAVGLALASSAAVAQSPSGPTPMRPSEAVELLRLCSADQQTL